jgi:type II secretory pathway component PulF
MEIFFHWLLAPLWGVLMGRAEATRQATLLWTLAAAVEKQFPLVAFLETVADEAGGNWRRKVRGLAELISAGTSIPDALEAMPGILPPDTLAMIRIGAQSGNMIGALREAARCARRRGEEPAAHFQGTLLYLTAILLALSLVVMFIMIWIIPKYKAIFAGFDVRLPALTETMIGFCDSLSVYWYLVFPVVALAGLGLWSFMAWGLELMGLGPVWSRAQPLTSRLLPRLKSPHLLRCLSIAVEGGRPLQEALQSLADRHPDIAFRRRMAEISSEVVRGDNCWLVLRAARILRRGEPVLLEAAQRVGNLTWALREMADRIERRAEYRYQLLVEFIEPVLFLLLGTVIGTFCLSLFQPLVELLNGLSGPASY